MFLLENFQTKLMKSGEAAIEILMDGGRISQTQ